MVESRLFTDHVRALAQGGAITNWDQVFGGLETLLRREIQRRGLWDLPPSFLGVQGGNSWGEGGRATRTKGTDALGELAAESYFHIFVTRLRGLKAQLLTKDNVDGLVHLAIRQFVHERQAEHDPIGAQTFIVVHAAVGQAIGDGELEIVSGDPRVRNDTVLEFTADIEAASASRDLGEIVAGWNDRLLPDLITLRGRDQEEVVRRLRDALPELRQAGIGTFRFQELIDPLKADVRARWASFFLEERESVVERSGEVVTIVRPETPVEDRQIFRALVDCVLKAVPVAERSEKTQGYLKTLFQFLRVQSEQGIDSDLAARLKHSVAVGMDDDDETPSHRRLAEVLRIPRERMNGLFQTLGKLLQVCRESVGGRLRAESGIR